MYRHANPRFYVGPNTNEIIVSIGRAYNVALSNNVGALQIKFNKRSVSSPVESVWVSYTVINGIAKFEIPDEFRTNIQDFPKGFYDGRVMIDDCEIGSVELIKAPGHYLSNPDSIEDKCHGDDDWVEPECTDYQYKSFSKCSCNCNGDPSNPCSCIYKVKNNCPTCYNQVTVANLGSLIDYIGLNEMMSCEPPENE